MWVFTVPVCSQTSQAQQQLSWEHMLNIRAYWAVENPPRNALPGTPYSQHSIPRLPKLCASWQEGWSSSCISWGSQNASSWNGPARVKSHSWLTSSGAAAQSQHAALLEQQIKGWKQPKSRAPALAAAYGPQLQGSIASADPTQMRTPTPFLALPLIHWSHWLFFCTSCPVHLPALLH